MTPRSLALPDAGSPPATADAVFLREKLLDLHTRFVGHRVIMPDDMERLGEAGRAQVRVIVQAGMLPLSGADMDLYPNLGLIVVVSAGHEGIDKEAAAARGIELRAGVGANADAVAEFTVGLVLAAVRRIVEHDTNVRNGQARMRRTRGLAEVKVGIVGLGHIGLATAKLLKPFGCSVSWTGPRPKPQVELPYVPGLVDLARQSDVLILTAHLDETTERMVNREVMDALGPQGILVNVARGRLVDEDALIAALREGRLGGAALDVFEEEPPTAERWRDVPNIILTPHTAGMTSQALNALFDRAVDSASAFLAKG